MRGLVLTTLGMAALGALGCKDSKAEKCAKGWDQMIAMARELAKAFGEDGAEMPGADEKKKFMEMCKKLPDDLISCLSDLSRANDPKCQAAAEKFQAEEAAANPVKLDWKSVKAVDDRITVDVPEGWTYEDFMGDTYSPPKDGDLGMFTQMSIDSKCGGDCAAMSGAEWAKRFDENEVANLKAEEGAEIVKDELLDDGGRVVVARTKMGGKTLTKLSVAKWKDGLDVYFVCAAELDPRVASALPGFEKACRGMTIAP